MQLNGGPLICDDCVRMRAELTPEGGKGVLECRMECLVASAMGAFVSRGCIEWGLRPAAQLRRDVPPDASSPHVPISEDYAGVNLHPPVR